jgi:hypothetical protein
MKNYYKILNVNINSSKDELILKYNESIHQFNNLPFLTDKMKIIIKDLKEAKYILLDDNRKIKYDNLLLNEKDQHFEEPPVEEQYFEEPHVEEQYFEEPHVEEQYFEEPHVEEQYFEEPRVEEPLVEEPHVEEQHFEEPHDNNIQKDLKIYNRNLPVLNKKESDNTKICDRIFSLNFNSKT